MPKEHRNPSGSLLLCLFDVIFSRLNPYIFMKTGFLLLASSVLLFKEAVNLHVHVHQAFDLESPRSKLMGLLYSQ